MHKKQKQDKESQVSLATESQNVISRESTENVVNIIRAS